MGITAKFSPENNIIWVTELKTGLPIEGAEVGIRDDNNRLVWKGMTDRNGVAVSPGWKSLDLRVKERWSKPQQWIFVRKGKDVAFSSSEWGTGIDPWRFGINYDWNPHPEAIQGYIFTEVDSRGNTISTSSHFYVLGKDYVPWERREAKN